MPTYHRFEYAHRTPSPEALDHDLRTPDALVDHYLESYSEPDDRVLDVFAGFGTTLRAAERLDRIPYGIEYEPDRVASARERIDSPENVHRGDALSFDYSQLPACDLCFTSPPFMERSDERNPFENYAGESSYDEYLDDVETVFTRLDPALIPGAHVVIDIANMTHDGAVTPLAWDVADRVSNVFHFLGEDVITWEPGTDEYDRDGHFGYGYDHSYVLVFRKQAE
ncbi:DNA methyltransferase [Halovivax limisalsi]|uniref:DNA methyltransferase n=1 Tax=Halovivax limisalsi TaxID=1453760 RepID=UPI001FFC866F|nr:DNA methyltransferase [Halovivax limisalsi]